jgi:hypothetical protein
MARKSRDYKAEYARRIAKGTAAGKTRQQARGHKPREHIIRRQREIERSPDKLSKRDEKLLSELQREVETKLLAQSFFASDQTAREEAAYVMGMGKIGLQNPRRAEMTRETSRYILKSGAGKWQRGHFSSAKRRQEWQLMVTQVQMVFDVEEELARRLLWY